MRWQKFGLKTRRSRPIFKKIVFLTGLVILSLSIYRLFVTIFAIRTIEIINQEGGNLKGIEDLGGENLLFLNEGKWEARIRKANPLIKKIEIEKRFPSAVLVKFEKRSARAVIFDPYSQDGFLIDQEGIILKREKKNNHLPTIIASLQNFKIGDRINNKSVHLALNLISVLEESAQGSKFEIDEIGKILKITLSNNVLILVSLDKKREKLVYSLQILAKKFKIEGSWPKKIDLRFEKPILTF